MSFFSSIKVFRGMLFGPDGLCESSKSIKRDLLVGVKGKIFAFVLDRQSVQCFGEYLIMLDFAFSATEVEY